MIVKPVFADGDTEAAKQALQGGPGPAQFLHLENLFKTILNYATTLAIIAVFLMLLYGGFKYLTAGGDPKAMDAGKNVITYAILGLVLMIGAWFLLQLIKAFTGVDVTQFNFRLPE